MIIWTFILSLLVISARADVGRIVKVVGDGAEVKRSGQAINVAIDSSLELGDEIISNGAYVVMLIPPGSQISLNKNTSLKITRAEIRETEKAIVANSSLELIKGIVRVQVRRESNENIDQRITALNVAFAVRGAEYEVSVDPDGAELDVFEGEVEVSSPLVQTFVPEIVRAKEGFRFDRRKRQFARRKLEPKFNDHPEFIKRRSFQRRSEIGKKRRQGR
jgi:hypothetical protein